MKLILMVVLALVVAAVLIPSIRVAAAWLLAFLCLLMLGDLLRSYARSVVRRARQL